MKNQLTKTLIERFSRQIILKDIGIIGQKKILSSKILVVGAGGLGCPVIEFLVRAGIGKIGILMLLIRLPKVREIKWLSLILR